MINTVTLNPAIDHILYLPRFRRNITNRIRSTQTTMGGKGTHVSLNLRLMGSPSRAFGFAFGKTGQRIIDMLREGGVEPYFIYDARGESRTNYLLVEEETKDATLVADRGPMPDGKQTEAFYRLLSETVQDGDCLALSGDTSNFPDPWIYNHILERLSNKEIRVFLDASGKSLHRGMEASPFLAKPNRDELAALVGETLTGDADVLRAIRKVDKYNIRVLAVSLGGDGSIVRAEDTLYRVYPPKVQVYNTVGCGDCYLGGLLHGFEQGMEMEEILRYATAVSAATAESPLSVFFDVERARELLDHVRIERI
ncbi:MAG: 1-phosphofructokinase family hexose kinase [Clostridiales bacterium]|nr:1-phosphofructokinase family hexose kinase [Bacillota bacterium]NLL54956.1 1-phosphofructokinase family hexose kinase [Clostridiales bacterium]